MEFYTIKIKENVTVNGIKLEASTTTNRKLNLVNVLQPYIERGYKLVRCVQSANTGTINALLQ